MTRRPLQWPEGKTFAFSIFDDPDAQGVEDGKVVYSFLADLGFRTTRGVWPLPPRREANSGGETCGNPEYLAHTRELQAVGFEVGYHNATKHSSTRDETGEGLDRFREYFGADPSAMANHYNEEAIYWGPSRLDPPYRTAYRVLTLGRTSGQHFGEVEHHPMFWGDLCRQRIRYCRNYVFADTNTLAACPTMPYHDARRPYVPAWFAASEGSNRDRFLNTLNEKNQDRVEEEGGACIMYTHFGHGFVEGGKLDPTFLRLMKRLGAKNGWFIPVSELLDHLAATQGVATVAGAELRRLQRRWLIEKVFRGTS